MKTVIRSWWSDKISCLLLLLSVVSNSIYVYNGALLLQMLSSTISEGQNHLQKNIINLIILSMIQTVLSVVRTVMRRYPANRIFTKLMDNYCMKTLDGDYHMYLKFSPSKVLTISGNIWRISYMGQVFASFINCVINVLILLFYIYQISRSIIIPIIFVYMIGMTVAVKLFSIYNKLDAEKDQFRLKRDKEMSEVTSGFAEVRTFVTQERHRQYLLDMNHKTILTSIKRLFVDGTIDGVINLIDGTITVAGVLIAINSIAKGYISTEDAIVLVMYIWRLVDPLFTLVNTAQEISESVSMIPEYDKFMNYQNQVSHKGNLKVKKFKNEISLKNVSFSYDDTEHVLNNIDMEIKKGSHVGICGPSGGGKSTLFKLLQMMYYPDDGTITFDGIDYQKLDVNSLRQHIGVVHQKTHIFDDTLYNNIRYGKWNATEHEIIEACKKANIYDFIIKTKDGFQTKVGPNGLRLSGGQQQRIALARVFLVDPEIIMLDEATSALDNESETLIQEVINRITDKTVITIAHRLSTIKDCDQIYVLKDSAIVEVGTHDELINSNGVYASLNK